MYPNFSDDILSCSFQQQIHDAKIKHISAGRELVDLSMINPDIAPARILIDKLVESSVKKGNHRYSVSRGIKKLRNAFADKYRNAFSVRLDPENNVCVTMGTKDGLVNMLAVLGGYSPQILLPSPTYPAHLAAAELAGFEAVFYNISQTEDKILSEIALKLKENSCKVLILNFPNNPTGQVVTKGFYTELKKILEGSETIVINDFVYGEMGFDLTPQPSLLSIFPDYQYVLESYSLSKAYSIPGWRIAAIIGNQPLIQRLVSLKSHIDYGLFLPLQIAAANVLYDKSVAADNALMYRKRNKIIFNALTKGGWKANQPFAGSALWTEIPQDLIRHFGGSMKFCLELLNAHGVLLSPGIIYGREYDNFVRIALVCTEEKLFTISNTILDFQSSVVNHLRNKNAA